MRIEGKTVFLGESCKRIFLQRIVSKSCERRTVKESGTRWTTNVFALSAIAHLAGDRSRCGATIAGVIGSDAPPRIVRQTSATGSSAIDHRLTTLSSLPLNMNLDSDNKGCVVRMLEKEAGMKSRGSGRAAWPELRPDPPWPTRCAGCGEIVDYQKIDDILLHHQHALERFWFRARTA